MGKLGKLDWEMRILFGGKECSVAVTLQQKEVSGEEQVEASVALGAMLRKWLMFLGVCSALSDSQTMWGSGLVVQKAPAIRVAFVKIRRSFDARSWYFQGAK